MILPKTLEDKVVKICKDNLLAQEVKRYRQQIVHSSPKGVITNWGERLGAYWEHGRWDLEK